jgi:hypothetical protein
MNRRSCWKNWPDVGKQSLLHHQWVENPRLIFGEKKRKNKSILECNVSCGIYLASHKYVLLLNDFIMTSSHQWWRLERRFLTQLWHASPVSNCRPLFASRNSDCSTVCELQAAANGYCEQLRLLAGLLIVSRHGKARFLDLLCFSPLLSLSLVCSAF